jgi:hypothetical protein
VNPEVFYLHIDGEQRGPYTIPQIDHLLNSGLIKEEATYWREGLEQWQPVTDLVRRRKPPKNWVKRAILAGIAVVLLLLLRLFGPIIVEGWREAAQFEYTPRAAYWRARDVVRHQALPAGTAITFGGFKSARVTMSSSPEGATVWLSAEVVGARGAIVPMAWEVRLSYDPKKREWAGLSVTKANR